MAPEAAHHHRSTTKISHKPYKARHASKNTQRDLSKGRVESGVEKGPRKTPHQQVMSKLDRRNQAKQKRIQTGKRHEEAKTVFAGKDGAPRIVAVIPLSDEADSMNAVGALNESLDITGNDVQNGLLNVEVERFKQRIQYVVARKELVSAMDAARIADFVLFVIDAQLISDELGDLILRSCLKQGISNASFVVAGLKDVHNQKARSTCLLACETYMKIHIPDHEKTHFLGLRQDCANLLRSLCTTMPKGVRWREDRSWMLVEDVRWPSSKKPQDSDGVLEPVGELVLTGIVRGKGLKADRLIRVADWGSYKIEKIVVEPGESVGKKRKLGDMAVDVEKPSAVVEQPTEDCDDLNDLAPEEVAMEDAEVLAPSVAATERKGVLLDNHHYFSDEEDLVVKKPRRLPKGTSKYQAAWYLADVSDSGSDLESVHDEDDAMPDLDRLSNPQISEEVEGMDAASVADNTEAGPSEYPASEMFLDPSPNDEAEQEQLAAYRARRKGDAEEDLEFPDEIELHPNVLARERLARYRGLKSFKTSPWETAEDAPYEPPEWRRLLEISDYRGAKSRVLREALVGGVKAGTRVSIHLRNVPLSLQRHDPHMPLPLFSLLRHEHKRTVVNVSINLDSLQTRPLRSKEELIMQIGPRRFVVNPIFSQMGNTPNDVHKFERFLHPGRSAVATFIAPLTWGVGVPALFFRYNNAHPAGVDLIATGSTLPPSTSRIIAKRAILTGHPYKIHKRIVTVRYMFFNAEDVQWFKALQLWTRRGRSGFIKESLGTHGYFKAMFDGKINPLDAVAVSLYKRVFPRSAREWRVGEGDEVVAETGDRREEGGDPMSVGGAGDAKMIG